MKVSVNDSDKKGVREEDDVIIVIVIFSMIGMAVIQPLSGCACIRAFPTVMSVQNAMLDPL